MAGAVSRKGPRNRNRLPCWSSRMIRVDSPRNRNRLPCWSSRMIRVDSPQKQALKHVLIWNRTWTSHLLYHLINCVLKIYFFKQTFLNTSWLTCLRILLSGWNVNIEISVHYWLFWLGSVCCWLLLTWFCVLLTAFDLVLFAVDFVVSRTDSHLFSCGWMTCVSKWYRRILTEGWGKSKADGNQKQICEMTQKPTVIRDRQADRHRKKDRQTEIMTLTHFNEHRPTPLSVEEPETQQSRTSLA